MIEIEVQNETHQTQDRLKFVAVPRIGEGIRLLGPDGFWSSYDVLDLWYQKAEFGDVWVPYIHVRITAGEQAAAPAAPTAPVLAEPQFAPPPRPSLVPDFALHDDFEDEGEEEPEGEPQVEYGWQEIYPFTA